MEFFILTLVNIGFLLLAFLYFRSRFQQSLNAPALLREVKDEVDVLVKELNVSAERNIAVLEERMVQMEDLLAQADAKLILMARELERREKSQETYSKLKKTVAPAAEPAAVQPEASPGPAGEGDQEGELFSGRPIEVPGTGLSGPGPAVPPPAKPRPLKDRVLELSSGGLEPPEISRQTGATLGEVELILSLHGKA